MRYLVDTNVWLEVLLNQESADEARDFLGRFDGDRLAITDFSLFSIGIILTRLQKDEVFESFVEDLVTSRVAVLGLSTQELRGVLAVREQFPLDFDDAYQYAVAISRFWFIVSFDHDFDKTEQGRMRPQEAQVEL